MSMFGGRARWKRGWAAFSTAAAAAASASTASAEPTAHDPYRWTSALHAAGRAAGKTGAGPTGSKPCRIREAMRCRTAKPGILDFSPQLRFTRRSKGDCSTWAFTRYANKSQQQDGSRLGGRGRWQSAGYGRYSHHFHNQGSFWSRGRKRGEECRSSRRSHACKQDFRRYVAGQLLTAYAAPLPKRQHACALHGSLRDKTHICGNGGGSWKAKFVQDQSRKAELDAQPQTASLEAEPQTDQPCIVELLARSGTIFKGIVSHAQANGLQAQDERKECDGMNVPFTPASLRRKLASYTLVSTRRLAAFSPPSSLLNGLPARHILPLQSTSGSYYASSTPAHRLFSTSPARRSLPVLLYKATGIFKTSAALSYVNLLFRLSVTVIPFGIRRALKARKIRLQSLAAGLGAGSRSWIDLFFVIATKSALALPFLLLGTVLLLSLERTPVTGRWRMLLLSEQEEADITSKVLEVGMPHDSRAETKRVALIGSRNWLSIMRAVLGEEDAPAGTLLGGRVLDVTDPRVHLVEKVLAKLESGIPHLIHPEPTNQATSSLATPSLKSSGSNVPMAPLSPPALQHPLTGARCQHVNRQNAVLVIERPESNAFSFGFFGSTDEEQPGVVIVFTGAIDKICGHQEDDWITGRRIESGLESIDASGAHSQSPSWLRYFGSLLPTASLGRRDHMQSEPSAQSKLVSKQQEDALAVLLAHELAHLVLSHTIESYANTTLLWPQLEKLGWDGELRDFHVVGNS